MIQSMPTSYKDIINDCIDQVTGDKLTSATGTTTTSTTTPMDVDGVSAVPPTPPTTLASNCKNRFTTQQYSDLTMLVEDSDETESVQEDANDPEWNIVPHRIQKMQ